METFEEATHAFLIAAKEWLTDEDAPMTASLVIMAKQLDKRFSAATMAQYGLSYRYLAKRRPAGENVIDPLEALLNAED